MLTPRILFHWRRIFRGVNLGKIPRSVLFQGIFPRKFLVQTELFAWRGVVFIFQKFKILRKILFSADQLLNFNYSGMAVLRILGSQ
jgi:hypothetical protein